MRTIIVYQGMVRIDIEDDGVTATRYRRDDDGEGGFTPWRVDASMTLTPDQVAKLDALEEEQRNFVPIHMGSM